MTPKEKPESKRGKAETAPASAAPAKATYQTFARKWRPQTFGEVVGQHNAVQSLRRTIEQQRIANAYLFCGPRGTGKTSMARILAKALNCAQGITSEPCGVCDSCRSITMGNNLDVIEIDGASYTRTEQIQEFLEGINRNPFSARYKVYIIDEVHMLSPAAFNRLLKTLEEPPTFVVFILATTNPEKIPATIISRCQVLEFSAIEAAAIKERLAWIASQEGVALDTTTSDAIFETLAHHAEGGLRDASVALDQLINLCDGQLTLEAAQQLLGLVDRDLLFQTMDFLQAGNTAGLMDLVDRMARKGRNLERFTSDLLGVVRDALMAKSRGDASLLQGHYTNDRIQWFAENLPRWDFAFLLNLANQILWAQEKMKSSANPRFLLEFAFIKLTSMNEALSVDRLANRLKKLAAAPMPMTSGLPSDQGQEAAAPSPPESAPASPQGAQTKLFNQAPAMDFMNGLGLRTPSAPAAMSDVLRDGGAAPPPPMARESQDPRAAAANIDVKELWARLRRELAEKISFLNNHLDDARPLALQGRRFDIGLLKNAHTEYNLNYLTSPAKSAQLGNTLAALLGFEVTIRWIEITGEPETGATAPQPASNASAPPTPPSPGHPGQPLQSSAANPPLMDSAPSPASAPASATPSPPPPAADSNADRDYEAAMYENYGLDEADADEGATPPLPADARPPRSLNEAFARFPEFKDAVTNMQRMIDGEIVGFEPA